MYPNLFGIDFLNMYGLCIGVGVILCLVFLRFACKRLNIPKKFEDFTEILAVISIGAGVLSGMLFQWITKIDMNIDYETTKIFYVLIIICIYYIFDYGHQIQLDSKGIIYGKES